MISPALQGKGVAHDVWHSQRHPVHPGLCLAVVGWLLMPGFRFPLLGPHFNDALLAINKLVEDSSPAVIATVGLEDQRLRVVGGIQVYVLLDLLFQRVESLAVAFSELSLRFWARSLGR